MSKPEVLEKAPMGIVEVYAALERIKTQVPDEQLNFRAQKTHEYAQEAARLSPKQAGELHAALVALEIPRLKDAQIFKLIDLLPASERQVKMILAGYHLTVTAESVNKIVEAIAQYAKK